MAKLRSFLGRHYLWGLAVVLLTIGGLGWGWAGRLAVFSTLAYFPRYSTVVYPLGGNAQITQEFAADYPGLYRLDFYFDNNKPDDDGRVIFRLKNSCQDSNDVTTAEVRVADLPDDQPYTFVFPPMDDSGRQQFCAVIQTEALADGSGLGIYVSAVDLYPDGAAVYRASTLPPAVESPKNNHPQYFVWLPLVQKSGATAPGQFDAGFKLYYNGPVVTTLQTLLTRLAVHKPAWFGWPGFYGGMFGVYFVVLLLFLGLVFGLKTGPKL